MRIHDLSFQRDTFFVFFILESVVIMSGIPTAAHIPVTGHTGGVVPLVHVSGGTFVARVLRVIVFGSMGPLLLPPVFKLRPRE